MLSIAAVPVVLMLSLAPACLFAADGAGVVAERSPAGPFTGQPTQARQAMETTENKIAGTDLFTIGDDPVRFEAQKKLCGSLAMLLVDKCFLMSLLYIYIYIFACNCTSMQEDAA